jgi:hypothetical protein
MSDATRCSQVHVTSRINATAKTLRVGDFDYSRCMAILDRIDAAADLMNDDWEAPQMFYLAASSTRAWDIGGRLFFTDDGGYADSAIGTFLTWFVLVLTTTCICILALSPALVTAACDNVTNELMSMQMEASQDPKRKEESMEIGALIHYYERKSPVSVLSFTVASLTELRLAMSVPAQCGLKNADLRCCLLCTCPVCVRACLSCVCHACVCGVGRATRSSSTSQSPGPTSRA